MSPRQPKTGPHNSLPDQIRAAAWKQIAESGAGMLSLRSIGRALNITAPAIYNYFPDRNALVTALIVEAFTSFGDALAESVAAIAPANPVERLRTLGLAYRDWAITFPERYQLIFGTPIAGYSAPAEITMPVAARSLAILVGILVDAYSAGLVKGGSDLPMTPGLEAMFKTWQAERGEAPSEVLFLALLFGGMVHGLVSQEIGHQYPPFISDAGEVYWQAIDHLIRLHLKNPS
jgi:AcrR family transcriptional regulator